VIGGWNGNDRDVPEDEQKQGEPEEHEASVLPAREAMSLISSGTDRGPVREPEQEQDRPEPES
jgi:hypothetical protein